MFCWFGQFFRLIRINMVLMRYGLDDIIFATHLFRPFRFVIYLLPWNWFLHNRAPRAARIRLALEALGSGVCKVWPDVVDTQRSIA